MSLCQKREIWRVSSDNFPRVVSRGDGYEAALVNFRMMANTVWTTEETLSQIFHR